MFKALWLSKFVRNILHIDGPETTTWISVCTDPPFFGGIFFAFVAAFAIKFHKPPFMVNYHYNSGIIYFFQQHRGKLFCLCQGIIIFFLFISRSVSFMNVFEISTVEKCNYTE